MGELRYFLGIEFCRSEEGIAMSQRKYALELFSKVGLAGAKPSTTHMDVNVKIVDASTFQDQTDELFSDVRRYQKLVGKLLYLTNTRPDTSFSVQSLSQFVQKPVVSQWNAALNVVRYIKGSPGLGLAMSSNRDTHLVGYCDADWATCLNTRRFVTGYLLKYRDSLISSKSKKARYSLKKFCRG